MYSLVFLFHPIRPAQERALFTHIYIYILYSVTNINKYNLSPLVPTEGALISASSLWSIDRSHVCTCSYNSRRKRYAVLTDIQLIRSLICSQGTAYALSHTLRRWRPLKSHHGDHTIHTHTPTQTYTLMYTRNTKESIDNAVRGV